MKIFLLFIFLIARIAGLSQPADTIRKGQDITDDSTSIQQNIINDTTPHFTPGYEIDTATLSRNMDSFLRLQKERRAKEKRAAIIRIAIGIALLGVLLIGLRRRKKQGSRF